MDAVSDSNPDRVLIAACLAAIEAGFSPQLEGHELCLRALLERLVAGDVSASREFAELLLSDEDARDEVVHLVTSKALSFVRSEFAKFEDLKSRRPLTDAEKRYGNECLGRLLESLKELFQRRDGTDDGRK